MAITQAARALADELRQSEEYLNYISAREKAMQNDSIRGFYKEYKRLQIQAQADAMAGRQSKETLRQLQHIGEFLQFDPDASEFLMAEYRLNGLLAGVYRLLAEAVDADLSMLEG
ncbi:MAG TPA: YlbF family regulator [Feifaniaceae bacterium]|nr:YlbF family regulator [Feifaniaceae bacterium]